MISAKDIEHLAELARIEVGEKEAEALAKDTEEILAYVKQVQDFDAEKASVGHGVAGAAVLRNVFRDDTQAHEPGAFTAALLAAAPEKEGGFFRVKKIL